MFRFSTLVCTLSLLGTLTALAQPNRGGTPFSESALGRQLLVKQKTEGIFMPSVNNRALLERSEAQDKAGPFQFGHSFPVSLGLDNAGEWTELPGGARLWRLRIDSKEAFSINLVFSEFFMPAGATLFVSDETGKHRLGAFTEANNNQEQKFATLPIPGEAVVLEYFEPSGVRGLGKVRVGQVVHAFRPLFNREKAYGYGDAAAACHIHVNCAAAARYQDIKRSVVLLLAGGGLCTGAMINNVKKDGRPLLLTADHCYGDDADVSSWLFVFNYEAAGCPTGTGTEGRTDQALYGSSVLARYAGTDLMLLELKDKPPASFNVFYAGWNRQDVAADSVVGIHHPAGDLKRISFSDRAIVSSEWGPDGGAYGTGTHWQVTRWDRNTVTEGGSSGSPLFNTRREIIGYLTGGRSACSGTAANNQPDWYGKVAMSWLGNGTASTRLKDHLDPNGTDSVRLSGMNYGGGEVYCGAAPSLPNYTKFILASFGGTFTNASSGVCQPYSDYSTQYRVAITKGSSFSTVFQLGFCSEDGPQNAVKVFADWNNDRDFSDSGEQLYSSGTTIAGGSTRTFSNTFPATVPDYAQVRVRLVARVALVSDNSNTVALTQPCGGYVFGETEDYTLQAMPTGVSATLTGAAVLVECERLQFMVNKQNLPAWADKFVLELSNKFGAFGPGITRRLPTNVMGTVPPNSNTYQAIIPGDIETGDFYSVRLVHPDSNIVWDTKELRDMGLTRLYAAPDTTVGVSYPYAFVCPGSQGVVQLTGTKTGLTYSLVRADRTGVIVSDELAGNGGTLTFYLPPDSVNAATNTFRVRVFNGNACDRIGSRIITLTQSPLPRPTITTAGGTSSVCPGQTLTLTAGTAQTSYVWKRNGIVIIGATGSTLTVGAPGSYTLSYGASGCLLESAPMVITPTAVTRPQLALTAGVLTPSGAPAAGESYQWYFNGTINGTPLKGIVLGADARTYTPLINGRYTLRVTSVAGCRFFTDTLNVTSVTAKASVLQISDSLLSITRSDDLTYLPFGLQVSPNPAPRGSQAAIRIVTRTVQSQVPVIRVVDTQGRVVTTFQPQTVAPSMGYFEGLLRTEGLAPGVYSIRVSLDNGEDLHAKLVVQ